MSEISIGCKHSRPDLCLHCNISESLRRHLVQHATEGCEILNKDVRAQQAAAVKNEAADAGQYHRKTVCVYCVDLNSCRIFPVCLYSPGSVR